MNSNYQINKFYAQERRNSHMVAAQAHRQAQTARGRTGRPSIARLATAKAVQVFHWTGRVISEAAQGMKEFGKANVSARIPHIH